jgi:hypothetical protein
MKAFAIIAVLIAVSAMAALPHAQGFPQPDSQREALRQQRQEELQQLAARMRERERGAQTSCALPDGSAHPINTSTTYEGQAYKCVEVFLPTPPAQVPPGEGQALTVRIAGWIKT